MSATYTPGRLTEGLLAVDYFSGGADLKRADGVVIGIEMSHDDARRLAACWNACEGSKTEDLEELGADYIKPLIKLIDECATARALLTELIDIEGPQPGTAAWAEKVRAFLKGGAA